MLSIRPDNRPTAVEVYNEIALAFEFPDKLSEEVAIEGFGAEKAPKANQALQTEPQLADPEEVPTKPKKASAKPSTKSFAYEDENKENGADMKRRKASVKTTKARQCAC
jgi:hypothetical protein